MRDNRSKIHSAAVSSVETAFGKTGLVELKQRVNLCDRDDQTACTLQRRDSARALSVTSSSSSLASSQSCCNSHKPARLEAASIAAQITQWWKQPAKLYTYDEVPTHLKDNKYILSGYRAFYTTAQCLRSVFRWHNESINIWLHWVSAIVFIAFVGAAIRWQTIVDAETGVTALATPLDRFVMAFYLTSAVICLFCSGLFHTFYCHSHMVVFDNMAITDYTGISLLISGSFTCMLYFGVRSKLDILPIPMVIMGMASMAGVILPWFPFFRSYHYRLLRTFIFLAIAATFSLTVIWAIAQVWEEVLQGWQWSWVLWLGGVALSYGGGAFIYAIRFPECLMPGKFDNFGASHQLWHLLVIAGAVCQWRLLVNLRDWRVLQDLAASL